MPEKAMRGRSALKPRRLGARLPELPDMDRKSPSVEKSVINA